MVSIFTAVMNRDERMADTLHNWLQFNWFDEVVIVDWSSTVPLSCAVNRETRQGWIKR
jgi:hypothetical protein